MSTEFDFVLSKDGSNGAITGNEGDARKIVQLLLQKETFFNGGGVTVPSYSHMQATPENIDSLRQKIGEKIRAHLPDISIQNIQVSEFKTNAILIGIAIGSAQEPYVFGISYEMNIDPSKVIYTTIW